MDRDQGSARLIVEAIVGTGVADIADRIADDLLEIDVGMRGDLAQDQDEAGRRRRLAGNARIGIVAQDPEPEYPVGKSALIAVLTNRGLPETRYVMPDLVGKDAEVMRSRLEAYGFRVGSARFESYEGVPANTILKQFPTAGSPLSSKEVVSVTVSRASEGAFAPVPQ